MTVRQKKRRRKKRHILRRLFVSILAIGLGAAASVFFLREIDPYPPVDQAVMDLDTLREMSLNRLMNMTSKNKKRLPVYAHRGFEENALENSFESFDAALLAGCPQIELDVRLSSDGVLYVVHDADLKSIAGSSGAISSMSSEQLDATTMKNGEKVHSLKEIVQRYGTQMMYLVEFKEDEQDIEPFVDVIRSYPQAAANIQVQSFYKGVIERIHNRFPNMFTQLLINEPSDVQKAIDLDWLDSLAIDQAIISKNRIEKVHEAGKECWIWTVDNPQNIRRFLSWGADGVITNLTSAVEIGKEYRNS